MKYIIDLPDNNEKFLSYNDELTVPITVGLETEFAYETGLKIKPYTEPDRKAIEDEVWEFVGTISELSFNEHHKCFDIDIDYNENVCHKYTYREAKTKYEEWKKQKDEVHVGDEVCYVEDHRKKVVVTRTYSDGFDAIDNDGNLYINRNPAMWKKTGRHFNEVEELLKKIRGKAE